MIGERVEDRHIVLAGEDILELMAFSSDFLYFLIEKEN